MHFSRTNENKPKFVHLIENVSVWIYNYKKKTAGDLNMQVGVLMLTQRVVCLYIKWDSDSHGAVERRNQIKQQQKTIWFWILSTEMERFIHIYSDGSNWKLLNSSGNALRKYKIKYKTLLVDSMRYEVIVWEIFNSYIYVSVLFICTKWKSQMNQSI